MNIELVALDLDGSLLDNNKNVSEVNKQAIKKARDKGVKVIICSGRVLTTSRMYSDNAGTDDLIVTCNGANVIDLKDMKYINHEIINMDRVEEVIDVLQFYDIYYHVYVDDKLVTEKMELDAAFFRNYNLKIPPKYRVDINIVDSVVEYLYNGRERVSKFVVSNPDLKYLNEVREAVNQISGIELSSSRTGNFEVMKKDVNKGKGIKMVSEYLNIPLDNVMAIGDNENDLSMLETAGFPVVMGNANDEIKEKGKYITKTNLENGVAYAIEKFIINA